MINFTLLYLRNMHLHDSISSKIGKYMKIKILKDDQQIILILLQKKMILQFSDLLSMFFVNIYIYRERVTYVYTFCRSYYSVYNTVYKVPSSSKIWF